MPWSNQQERQMDLEKHGLAPSQADLWVLVVSDAHSDRAMRVLGDTAPLGVKLTVFFF